MRSIETVKDAGRKMSVFEPGPECLVAAGFLASRLKDCFGDNNKKKR